MVNGYWLCARCYAKLPHRPHRYITTGGIEGGDVPARQEIINAPIAKAHGITLGQFVTAMALRLIAVTRGGFHKHDALDYAVDILRVLGDPFGSNDLDWTSSGARELVAEDMQSWDVDERLSN
ncbi:hypothetical protein [Salipiger sp. PrR003]|uniref:hypothetical protein n=1 Tax=Salipiger sp. PrR003 TaxID=2706776 RepID=UPI0013DB74DE|nr:hypothetical protein [Salipiger sp. PrR003]NDV50378.1 hypothetical protein [Salipiger sp. PrR003]